MVLSSLPPPLFLPPSLPFSLSSVQHPGLKILRSDSSSSISSRIGWTSPLSPNCLSFLCLVWFGYWFSISPGPPSSRFLLFSLLLLCSLHLHLFFFFGLALSPCLADCDHLTDVSSLFCSSSLLTSLPPLPRLLPLTRALMILTLFQGFLTLVWTPVGWLCLCVFYRLI